MADLKISALTSAGALAGTEPLPIVQGGTTKKTTAQDIANLKATPDIQQVLDAGDISTTAIIIDDGAGNSVSVGTDLIKFINTIGGTAQIKSSALANNVIFEIPNKSAGTETFAMLSDITGGGDVYLANDQTFTGENTFAIASGSKEPIIVTKGGNGAAIKVTKSSGSGDAIEVAAGSVSIDDETASTIASFDGSKRIKSLATSTYPSLTELSYVKGVTSAIQTQLNALANTYSINVISITLAAPLDATSYHFGLNVEIPGATPLRREFKFPQAGTMTAFSFNLLQSTNGSNETCTLYLRNTTTSTDYTIGTFTSDFGLNGALKTLYSGLSIAINTTDNWVVKILTPTWGTNPMNWLPNGLILITT
jgi:hypothetical protein